MQAAPRGVPVVYMSSITAFGIPDFHQPLREYRFSRNMYGACKREGERLAVNAAKRSQRPAYVLRLGVVHGELQAVSRQTLQQVRLRAGVTTWIPDAPSYAVFAFSIAEALLGIAQGRETPGQYTMLSSPAWTWRDVHDWYCRRAGVEPDVALLAPEPAPSSPGVLHSLVFSKKDVISAYVSASSPALENHLRGVYHLRTASREIAAGLRNAQYRPYGNNHTDFPGTRPRSISDSRVTMEPIAAQVREQVAALTRQRMGVTAGGVR
jgi:nucleoside-diphosphate-sugar epimerase